MKIFSRTSKIVLSSLFICSIHSLYSMQKCNDYVADTAKKILQDTEVWNALGLLYAYHLTPYHKTNLHNRQLHYALMAGGLGSFIKNGTTWFDGKKTFIDVAIKTTCQVAPVLAYVVYGAIKSHNWYSLPMVVGSLYVGTTFLRNLNSH